MGAAIGSNRDAQWRVMNGKPGDHPITDIMVHGLTVFSPKADTLITEIVKLGGRTRLETELDLFVPPALHELENRLERLRNELRDEAKQRGWEV